MEDQQSKNILHIPPEIVVPNFLTRAYLASNPQYIFVWGGNQLTDLAVGQGANAVGLKNCFKVPTKVRNCKSDSAAYFHDCQLGYYEDLVDRAIEKIPIDERPIILFPKIGAGCSRLKHDSPMCYHYLMNWLNRIAYPNVKRSP